MDEDDGVDSDGGPLSSLDDGDEAWSHFLIHVDDGTCGCNLRDRDHYHCRGDGCNVTFTSLEGAQDHGNSHAQQERISEGFYTFITPDKSEGCPEDCPYKEAPSHYHCSWVSPKTLPPSTTSLLVWVSKTHYIKIHQLSLYHFKSFFIDFRCEN